MVFCDNFSPIKNGTATGSNAVKITRHTILMFYFQRRLLKQINTQLKQDVFHALMKKGVAKFTEKNSAVYLSVLNNDVTNLENNYFAKIPEILKMDLYF